MTTITQPGPLWLLALAFSLACCGPAGTSDVFVAVSVDDNPNNVLSAKVEAETVSTCQVSVVFSGSEVEERTTGRSPAGTVHVVTVAGMRPEATYRLIPVAHCGDGDPVEGEPLDYTTGALPPGVPAFSVTIHEPDLVQPGITFFGPARMGKPGEAGGIDLAPTYLGVDESGAVVWYYVDPDGAEGNADRDLKMLPDGNLLITLKGGLRVIDLAGETVAEVRPDRAGVSGFHHDGLRLPGGGYLTLSSEIREVTVPDLGGAVRAKGDVILELSESGREVWRWSTFDHLDPTRYPTDLSRKLDQKTGVYDWTHSNAVYYVEEDDSILLSVRHQNWVVRIDHQTGEIQWRLGEEGDIELTNFDPAAGNDWFFSQHAPELHPDGTLVLYDNGNDRPVEPGTRFSRAVMYRLDEGADAAEQVWAYRTDHFTGALGDADLLDNGNVLACAGGHQEPGVPAQIVEVTGEASPREVWELEIEDYHVYRATRLASLWPD